MDPMGMCILYTVDVFSIGTSTTMGDFPLPCYRWVPKSDGGQDLGLVLLSGGGNIPRSRVAQRTFPST